MNLPAPSTPRIFISYARSDGEAAARELRARLLAEGLTLWRDREGLEGGRDWWLQIKAAIDSVEFLVLVFTPAAITSSTVRREWRYAREVGVVVYPVRAHPELDFAALPRWMRSVHFCDPEHEWTRLVYDLQATPRRVRVPFMAEDLPPDYVPRPAETEAVIAHLLDREREEPVAITAALRGAGGYGKTALARAVCHDEAVQNAFDDGILWVTLGEQPGDLAARLKDLIFFLSGQRPDLAGLDAAQAAFAELLVDRDILLVIDDVWDASHLRPFLMGGKRCARIITTRSSDVLPADAQRIPVDAMQGAEAVALLGQGLPAGEAPALAALARRLGEWPLLLKLVNAALRDRAVHDRQLLPAALAHVNRALDKGGLTHFDARDATARHQAVAKTLETSIARLHADEQLRFAELAVFPEDVDIPLATLSAFWSTTGGLDDFDTEVLCERLSHLSLVLNFDPTARFLRLHDVVRHFLRHQLKDRLTGLHLGLLSALRPSSGAWADLEPSEAYGWSWVFHHLDAAGLHAELFATAQDLRFLLGKTMARSTFAVEADLAQAVALAGRDAAMPPADHAALQALHRGYVQCAHLLNGLASASEGLNTLFTRLQHTPALRPLLTRWAAALPPLHLRALHALPDLPHPALLRTLTQHSGAVLACAVSPDSRRLATAGTDRVVQVVDSATGALLHRLSGHTGWVLGLAISADGRVLASASADRRLRLWDLASGQPLAVLAGHTDGLTACALSADASIAVSASHDGALKVWNVATASVHRTLARSWSDDAVQVPVNHQGHWSTVHDCALSPDGQWLASASSDQTLILWDLVSGRAVRVLAGHTAGVHACAFSPDGLWLASGSADRSARVWNVATGEAVYSLSEQAAAIVSVAFSPDGARLWCALADGRLKGWDLARGIEGPDLPAHADRAQHCAVAPNGRFVVSTSSDGTAKLWDADAADSAPAAAPQEGWLLCCGAQPGSVRVAVGSERGALVEWDVVAGHAVGTIALQRTAVYGSAVNAGGTLFASCGADRLVQVWSGHGAAPRLTLAGHRDRVNGCAIDPQSCVLATVSSDRSLRLWDLRTRARKLAFSAHEHEVNCCAIAPDGSRVATGAEDGNLCLWTLDVADALWEQWLTGVSLLDAGSVQRNFRPRPMARRSGAVNTLAWSSAASGNGEFLVSGTQRGAVDLWDAADGRLMASLQGHAAPVTGCSVHPDRKLVASSAADGELRVWHAETGRSVAGLRVDGALLACAWVDDGRCLIAVGARGLYAFSWIADGADRC